MACVSQRKSPVTKKVLGFTVQFYDHNGIKRKLYSFAKRSAATLFGENVDDLVSCLRSGSYIDVRLRQWIDGLPQRLYDRLVVWGLVPERNARITLGALVKIFVDGEQSVDAKPGTIKCRERIGRQMTDYFGLDTLITSITKEQANRYYQRLKATKSPVTWGHEIRTVKQFFSYAVKHDWIVRSPFEDCKGTSATTRHRQYFVDNETITRILEHCASSQDRLILCLSRYGGLRLPSELQFMEWSDINFERNQFLVKTPKKEKKDNQSKGRFTDRATRIVPMFPELQKAFMEYYEDFPENGPALLFSTSPLLPQHLRVVLTHSKLMTRFRRPMKLAGVREWPKFFQNMRSTRETELYNMGYTLKDVCAIIGNTPDVAMRHYVQDSHDLMERAINLVTNSDATDVGRNLGTKVEVD